MPAPKGNKHAAGNHTPRSGRPTRYRKEFVDDAYELCLLGATDQELAEAFGVHFRTIENWKKRHVDFSVALTRGKLQADAKVAASLYHRATGYSHPEDKIFQHEGKIIRAKTTKHYPPDTAAASLWLRNRQPGKWRDKPVPHPGLADEPIVVEIVKFGSEPKD